MTSYYFLDFTIFCSELASPSIVPLRACCGNLRCDPEENIFICPRDCQCLGQTNSCCRNADCTPFCQDKTTLKTNGQCLALGAACTYATAGCKPNEEVCRDAACVEAHEFVQGQLKLLDVPFIGFIKKITI